MDFFSVHILLSGSETELTCPMRFLRSMERPAGRQSKPGISVIMTAVIITEIYGVGFGYMRSGGIPPGTGA